MKCRIDSGNTCRRCERAGLPCIFVPRANASAFMVPASMPLAEMASYDVTRDILRRVKIIEDHLGLPDVGKVDEAEAKPVLTRHDNPRCTHSAEHSCPWPAPAPMGCGSEP